MATRYTFNAKGDYFNSVLSSDNTTTSYTIQCSGSNKSKPDYTSITSSNGRSGAVHWRRKDKPEAFVVGGATYGVSSISSTELVSE